MSDGVVLAILFVGGPILLMLVDVFAEWVAEYWP